MSRTLASLLPPLVALVVHATIFPGDFVFDDVRLVEEDRALREGDLGRIFADTYWGPARVDLNYRPVTLATYAANHAVSNEAWTFRAVNWLLHALAAWLAFRVLEQLLEDRWLASLCATAWAALAIHSEAVANVVGRAELLAAIAVLVVWWLSLRDASGRSGRIAILGGAVLLLGIASKESAIVAVPIVLAGAWARRRPLPWRLVATSALATLVYLGVRWLVTAENRELVAAGRASLTSLVDNPLIETDLVTATLNGFALLALYAWKTLVPITLSADYSFDQLPVRPAGDPLLWALVVPQCLLYGAALTLLWKRRLPLLALGVLFFPIAFAVTGNVAFRIGTIFGERLAFLPSLALPLTVGALTLALSERLGRRVVRRAAMLGLVALTVAQGARAAIRDLDWQDRSTLYERTAESSPDSYRANLLGSQAALRRSRDAESPIEKGRLLAIAHARVDRALEILPEGGRALGRRGEIRFEEAENALARGEGLAARLAFTEAFETFGRAWERLAARRQSEPLFLVFRARAAFQLGRFEEAAAEFDGYIRFVTSTGSVPEPSTLHLGALAKVRTAQTLFGAGDLEGALASADAAIAEVERATGLGGERARLESVRGVALAVRAEVAGRRGDDASRTATLRQALAAFDAGVRADPGLAELRTNRGFCRFLLGDGPGAIEDYRAGLEICEREGPRFHPSQDSVWGYHRKLSSVHRGRGETTLAERHEAAAAAIEARVRGG